MKYPYMFVAMVLFAVLAIFTGCGGGGSNDITTNPNLPPTDSQTGSATFVINWPAQTRGVPVGAGSLYIKMTLPSGKFVDQVANRPGQGLTSQVVFPNLPMGIYAYTITAYNGAQKSGTVLGKAAGALEVKNSAPDAQVHANALLKSTIAAVFIFSENATAEMTAGTTMRLLAIAVDEDGYMVPIGANCLQWSSKNEDIATVDPETGTVTGLRGGDAKIEVREVESDVVASIDIDVFGLVAKLITPTTAGTTATLFTMRAESWTGHGPSQDPIEVRWDWNGDGTYDTKYFNTQDFDHQYTQPGTYNLTVQIKDALGRTDTASRVITVDQDPNPIHVLSTYQRGSGIHSTAGYYYFWLDNATTDTSDPFIQDNEILEGYYRYDWDGDEVYDTDFLYYRVNPGYFDWFQFDQDLYPYSLSPVVAHRFSTVGTKIINVQVKDSFGRVGTDRQSIVITIDNWNP